MNYKVFPIHLSIALCVVAILFPGISYGDIYRCDKQAGVITLSNVEKGKNCKKMILPPPEKRPAKTSSPAAPDAASATATTPSPEAKQSKSKSSYESAVSERKRIIQEEMDLEQDRLDKANDKIASLSNIKKRTPAQEKELKHLQEKQSLYQSNITLLRKEASK